MIETKLIFASNNLYSIKINIKPNEGIKQQNDLFTYVGCTINSK